MNVYRNQLLLACLVAMALTGCDFVHEVIYGPTLPPVQPRPEITIPVPFAVTDLSEEHRIKPDDIAMRDMTRRDMAEHGLNLREVMTFPDQIIGRVTRLRISEGEPFNVTDLYLEGTEPDAPPEPDTPEPPWPEPEHLKLLIDWLEEQRKNEGGKPETVILPWTSNDLPAGRRIRKSDIGFVPMFDTDVAEHCYPDFEVMTDIAQFKGRRLRKPKYLGEPFLLSDFYVDEAVGQYLQDRQR